MTDRVTVITGIAGGIGQAISQSVRRDGGVVAGLDITDASDCDLMVCCDVTSEKDVRAAFDLLAVELGPPSALVAAAGIVSERPVETMDLDEWMRVIDVSLTGTFLASRAAIPHLRQASDPRIVAFSSGYAAKGYRNGAHYAAAKAGVEALVKSLALELAPDGVTVNAVAPGPVETGMLHGVADRARLSATEEIIPLGRLGTPDDLVGLVSFLLSSAAGYLTGQVIHVNGGMLMP